jgi:hypothetical protein
MKDVVFKADRVRVRVREKNPCPTPKVSRGLGFGKLSSHGIPTESVRTQAPYRPHKKAS